MPNKARQAIPAHGAPGVTRPERHDETLGLPEVGPCDDLHVLIAKRAYERYQARGRRHGYDLDDWLEAEREVLSQVLPL